jgi:hypothetical protein
VSFVRTGRGVQGCTIHEPELRKDSQNYFEYRVEMVTGTTGARLGSNPDARLTPDHSHLNESGDHLMTISVKYNNFFLSID